MSKDERIVGYVDSSTMAEVDAITEQHDWSKSEYVARAVSNQLERDKMGEIAKSNTLEMKLLRLVDDATDRAADQLVNEAADEIALAVTKELRKIDQRAKQHQEQQQKQQQNQQQQDSTDSGLID